MITIGVDAHKGVHVALALDEAGQELSQWQGLNNAAGWRAISQWAASLGGPRQWGVEGAWGYGRNLAQHLVAEGETVYEVNPRWTAMGRRSARKPGKTDHLDARAVALLVRQEASALPLVHAEDDTVVLDLLTSEREAAVAESTRLRNQIRALLSQTDLSTVPTSQRSSPRQRSMPLRATRLATATPSRCSAPRPYAGLLSGCDWRCLRPRSWLGRSRT